MQIPYQLLLGAYRGERAYRWHSEKYKTRSVSASNTGLARSGCAQGFANLCSSCESCMEFEGLLRPREQQILELLDRGLQLDPYPINLFRLPNSPVHSPRARLLVWSEKCCWLHQSASSIDSVPTEGSTPHWALRGGRGSESMCFRSGGRGHVQHSTPQCSAEMEIKARCICGDGYVPRTANGSERVPGLLLEYRRGKPQPLSQGPSWPPPAGSLSVPATCHLRCSTSPPHAYSFPSWGLMWKPPGTFLDKKQDTESRKPPVKLYVVEEKPWR